MKAETKARSTWRSDLLPLIIVLLLTAMYFVSFFNRFAGLRSGDGEFGGGIAFLAGLRPYRDYFTAGPPLNVFKSALELSLFGKTLLVSRMLGVVERLLITGVLFAWLRRYFSQKATALAAFVAVVVSAGDHTDPIASYNHDAILLAMLCGFLVCCGIDTIGRRSFLWFGVLSGVCGGLSLATKQTVGASALLFVAAGGAIAAARVGGWKVAARWVGSFVCGATIPVILVAAYLWRLGALHACLDMMFVSGPKAKASHPLVFLAREVMIAGLYRWWLFLAVFVLVVSGGALYKAALRSCAAEVTRSGFWIRCGAVSVTLLIVLLATTAYAIRPVQNSGKAAVYFVLLGTIYLGVLVLQRSYNSEGEERDRAVGLLIFSALSLAVALSLSLSFPAFEAMVLPGLGLLVAACFDGAAGKWKAAVFAFGMLAVALQVREKLAYPFGFDHQDEARVSEAVNTSDDPMLRGMRLPASTMHFLHDVSTTMRSRAGREGRLFTYPEMGLLYSLTGRYPPTQTASHNIDVVNDDFARSEAVRLLASPPAIIVYAKPSEEDMRIAELVWREGRPSGQRSIMAAIERIVASYDLIGTYQLEPQDSVIRIYARPLPAASGLIPVELPRR